MNDNRTNWDSWINDSRAYYDKYEAEEKLYCELYCGCCENNEACGWWDKRQGCTFNQFTPKRRET
jgi:hypothetical protein